MLDLEKNGKKEEISDRICEFLLEPKDSGKPIGGGRPKRASAVRANNRGTYLSWFHAIGRFKVTGSQSDVLSHLIG